MRTTLLALAAVTCSVGSAAPMHAQTPPQAVPSGAPLLTTNQTLRDSLDRIAKRSALWRADLEAVRNTGRRIIVLTPEQVVVADTPNGDGAGAFDPTMVAAAAPVPSGDSRVDEVLVVVNLPLIQDAHRRKGSLDGEMHLDLDLIVVHEVYGHAMPYLLAGDMSGRCADPVKGQPPTEACSIRRENALRKELGLTRRTSYGLEGLTLARF